MVEGPASVLELPLSFFLPSLLRPVSVEDDPVVPPDEHDVGAERDALRALVQLLDLSHHGADLHGGRPGKDGGWGGVDASQGNRIETSTQTG